MNLIGEAYRVRVIPFKSSKIPEAEPPKYGAKYNLSINGTNVPCSMDGPAEIRLLKEGATEKFSPYAQYELSSLILPEKD